MTASYASEYLQRLVARRQLFTFWKENLAGKFTHTYLLYAAHGRVSGDSGGLPSLRFIYAAGRLINPACWFYAPGEPLPEILPPAPFLEGNIECSRNFRRLKEIANKSAWCTAHDVNRTVLWGIISRRKIPSPKLILHLKSCLPPEDWFQ